MTEIYIANAVIYGLFGIAVILMTRHHNRKMEETWDKWDKEWEKRSNIRDE